MQVQGLNWNIFRTPPEGYEFGEHPEWMVTSRDAAFAAGAAPRGYYVPDLAFLQEYQGDIVNYVNNVIGEWAIVAFEGGKLGGTGYSEWFNPDLGLNIVLTSGDQAADYFVHYDPDIDDVLVVAADPVLGPLPDTPNCDIEGFDCDCEKKPPLDPFQRKPTPDYRDEWFE